MIRVAINGMGRIGRAAFKVLMNDPQIEIVAVNDLAAAHQLAYLLNFDTVYGKLNRRVGNDYHNLYVNHKSIRVLNIPEPNHCPWGEMNIDVVLECTGKFLKRHELQMHINSGAKRVILSAPSEGDDVPTLVHGVNNEPLDNPEIVSCATCTTNAVAPILEIIERRIGVKKSVMTTVHAYTSNQSVIDGVNTDLRRGRAAAANFIPGPTGASVATSRVLPGMRNKFEGLAIQGPVPVGSLADVTILTQRGTSLEEISRIFSEEAGSERYIGVLGVNTEPIVSSDIMLDPRASVIDLTLTQVVDGDMVKIFSWYDNEWGYVNQMVKEMKRLAKLENKHNQYNHPHAEVELMS